MRSKIAVGLIAGILAVFGAACEEGGSSEVEDVSPEAEEGQGQDNEELDAEDVTPELDESSTTTAG